MHPDEAAAKVWLLMWLVIWIAFVGVILLWVTGGILSRAIAHRQSAFWLGTLAYGAAWVLLSRWNALAAPVGGWLASAAAGGILRWWH